MYEDICDQCLNTEKVQIDEKDMQLQEKDILLQEKKQDLEHERVENERLRALLKQADIEVD